MTARTSKSGPSSVVSDDASGDLHKSQSNANSPRAKRVSRRSANKPKPPPVRAFVEHHYHDHARDPVAESVEVVGHRSDGVMSRSFPEKLHQLLEAMHEEGLEHIVSWQPHGRCFAIHQKTEFVNDIMPRFFMQTKLTSFQRQLNLYGFIRLTTGPDRGGYYHEYFLRGRPDLCQFMVRTRVKGIGMKAASSPATEPNFYSYETCPPEGPVKTVDDCDASTTSEKTEPYPKNSLLGMVLPKIVSPPDSPVLSSAITKPFDTFLDEIMDVTQDEDLTPHTGDEVYFEGLSFRYLDHLDLDDVHELTVTNVEYL